MDIVTEKGFGERAYMSTVRFVERVFTQIDRVFTEVLGLGELSAAAKVGSTFAILGIPLFVFCIIYMTGEDELEYQRTKAEEEDQDNTYAGQ